MALKVGDKLPKFKLKDHKGFDVTDIDISGIPVVLLFFPKSDPSASQTEMCNFRDKLATFDKLRALVIGVSSDTIESIARTHANFELVYTLLSDEKGELAKSFGVIDKSGHVIRSAFVINADKVIGWIEKPVELKGLLERAEKAVKENCKSPQIRMGIQPKKPKKKK